MNYIGLDVHKKTISYCVKDVSGRIQQEGRIGSTRRELDYWMKTLPQPWTVAMEATIFSGWIYDHLLSHATQIKVAHPLMLRAIAAAKKKNDQIDPSKRFALRFGSPVNLMSLCGITSSRVLLSGAEPQNTQSLLGLGCCFMYEILLNPSTA